MKRLIVVLSILLAVAALALAAFGAYWVDSRDTLRHELETILSATFETPVQVGELNISLYPNSRLVARRVSFADQGKDPHLSVGAVYVDVDLKELWRGDLIVTQLRFEDFRCRADALVAYASKLSKPSESGSPVNVALQQITAAPVHLILEDGSALGPYRVLADFGADGEFEALAISRLDQPLMLRMTRDEPGRVALALEAKHWQPQLGPPLRFERVEAKGYWSGGSEFEFTQVQGRAYGGSLTGAVYVGWQDHWVVKGRAWIKGVDGGAVLAKLGYPVVKAKADWNGRFELQAREPARLLERLKLAGDIWLRRGTLFPPQGRRRRGDPHPVAFQEFQGSLELQDGQIRMRGLTVTARQLFSRRLGPYRLAVDLRRNGGLKSFTLRRRDGRMGLSIQPRGKGYSVRLNAKAWVPPVGSPLLLNQLDLTGRLAGRELRIQGVKAKLYGGAAEASGSVSWNGPWAVDLKGRVSGVSAEPFLAVFDKRVLSGKFYATARARLRASAANRLFDKPFLNGDFLVRHGAVYKMDLQKAAKNFSKGYVTGGQTRFDELSGHLAMADGSTLITKLRITSSGFEAKGKVAVDAGNALDGEVDVGVKSIAAIVGIPVKIGGTTDEPRLRPTTAALAGAAAGTAVLGPGLGTAIGLKAGQALKRLTDFLDRIGGKKKSE